MYRDQPSSGPACHKHASSPAAASCIGCGKEICEICLVYDLAQPSCHPCARRARIGRRVRGAAVVALVVGALGSAVVYVVTRPKSFDYGVHTAEVSRLRGVVDKSRCDRQATLALEDAMIDAGDAQGAIADSDAFYRQCGDWSRLRWERYSAYERLGRHDQAIAEATKLIEHDPDDHDYRWWRGVAYEAMGKLDEAVADYRAALAITPSLDGVPFNLARALEQQHKYCEAAKAVAQYLTYHPGMITEPRIQQQLIRLNAAGHCAEIE